MLLFFAFVLELIIAGAISFWLVATLGFADEAHRTRKASPTGRVIAALCVAVALASPVLTLVVTVQYFVLGSRLIRSIHPLVIPVVIIPVSAALCSLLIYFYNRSYKQ